MAVSGIVVIKLTFGACLGILETSDKPYAGKEIGSVHHPWDGYTKPRHAGFS
jgi:hypothetical protein